MFGLIMLIIPSIPDDRTDHMTITQFNPALAWKNQLYNYTIIYFAIITNLLIY